MNCFGQHSLNQAADGFNPVAIVMLYIGDIGRKYSLGMLFTNRLELNTRCCQQHVFYSIVVIGVIRIHMTPFQDIKSEGFEHTYITRRAWSQEALDWLPIFGHQEMHFTPINIAFLTGHTSSIFLMLISLRPWNPIIVTDNDWKAINDIDRCSVELLPGASSEVNQYQEQIRETMEPTVQTTAAEPMWQIPRHAQEGTRGFTVAAKAPHGHQARRDDFGIAHLLVRIFRMAERLQDIRTQAINGQDLVVHGGPRLSGGKWITSTHPGG
jgi:hypothetical protein